MDGRCEPAQELRRPRNPRIRWPQIDGSGPGSGPFPLNNAVILLALLAHGPCDFAALQESANVPAANLQKILDELIQVKFVKQADGAYHLTPRGVTAAQRIQGPSR